MGRSYAAGQLLGVAVVLLGVLVAGLPGLSLQHVAWQDLLQCAGRQEWRFRRRQVPIRCWPWALPLRI